jgi:peptidoglycan hydrolase-like protein with peptidoglycan-binding domain
MDIRNQTKEEIRALQLMLIGLGFDVGKSGADGIMGPKTEAAYAAYLASRPKDPTVFLPVQAKPWWDSKAMLSGIATVATGAATLAAVVGSGGIAAIAAPEAIGAIAAIVTGAGAIYGTATRSQPIDPNLVAPTVRITRS